MNHPSDFTHYLVYHLLPQALVVGSIFLVFYLIVLLGGRPGNAEKRGSQKIPGRKRRQRRK